MKVVYKHFMLYIPVIAMLLSFCSCSFTEPPEIDEVERTFQKHYDDIQIVVDFMISSEYEIIMIDSFEKCGIVKTYEYHRKSEELVLDAKTEEAINRLLDTGYENMAKVQNTIKFQEWHRFNDVGCGVAYTINEQDLPEIQYVTEIIPLEKDGWYYYVVDFNQWRLENTT